MDPDDRAPPVRATFNRYRFCVDVEVDPEAFLESSPAASLGVQGALESEIN